MIQNLRFSIDRRDFGVLKSIEKAKLYDQACPDTAVYDANRQFAQKKSISWVWSPSAESKGIFPPCHLGHWRITLKSSTSKPRSESGSILSAYLIRICQLWRWVALVRIRQIASRFSPSFFYYTFWKSKGFCGFSAVMACMLECKRPTKYEECVWNPALWNW